MKNVSGIKILDVFVYHINGYLFQIIIPDIERGYYKSMEFLKEHGYNIDQFIDKETVDLNQEKFNLVRPTEIDKIFYWWKNTRLYSIKKLAMNYYPQKRWSELTKIDIACMYELVHGYNLPLNTDFHNKKSLADNDLIKTAMEIAMKKSKDILSEMGISSKDSKYAEYHYELQFGIYHAIKDTLKLKSE